MKVRWSVIWQSRDGSGNDLYETPADWPRQKVWQSWEAAHPECFVMDLVSIRSPA